MATGLTSFLNLYPKLLPPRMNRAPITNLPPLWSSVKPHLGGFCGSAFSAKFRQVAVLATLIHGAQNSTQKLLSRHRHDRQLGNDFHDLEEQLNGLFNEVKTLFDMGNKHDAVTLLEANYERVKEKIDAGFVEIGDAALLDVICLSYMGIGVTDHVKCLMDQLCSIIKESGNDEPFLASILVHMGGMFSHMGMTEEALHHYQRSLEVLEEASGKDQLNIVTPLLGMAKIFQSIGRTNKAADIYKRLLDIYEANGVAKSEELVVPLSKLGNIFLNDDKCKEAALYLGRIIDVYKEIYGASDGRVGMAMCSLAHALCGNGDVEEAINVYKNGLKIIMDSNFLQMDDSLMEKMRIDLAELLHVSGSEEEGRALLEECLLITERHKGKEHPDIINHLANLATSYSHSKNYVEAERLLRRSMEILSESNKTTHPSSTVPMLQLAIVLYHLHKDDEAEKLATEAFRIRESAFGDESPQVGEALDCLVSMKIRLGKHNEVIPLLRRVLNIQEKSSGFDSEQVTYTLRKLVYYLDKTGNKAEKQTLQKRLAMLRRKYRHKVPT